LQNFDKALGAIILFVMALCLAALPERAALRSASGAGGNTGTQANTSEPVPAFHSEAPKGPLPATMDPNLFEQPLAKNAYVVAARIKKVLYQQPCYCHCDQSQGHGSLLDCFVSKHGAGCGTCMREALYSYEQTRKGKTPAQIREGIERGDWQNVDFSKYEKPLPAPTVPTR
jgi:Protein of unknown function with PCYCGC motif